MASQEELNNEQQLNEEIQRGNELLSQRRGIELASLNDVRDFTNALQDQAKQLRFQSSERKQINSLSSNLNKIAQQNYSILEQELGTEQLLKKIKADQTKIDKSILGLQSLQGQQLGDNAELNFEIQNAIQGTVLASQSLLKQLEFVKITTAAISQDIGVKMFGGLSDIAKAIPGLNRFSTPFKEAEEAARKQVILNEKLKDVNLKTGEGLTKEKIIQLGLENKLLDKNGEILTGTAAAVKIRQLGLDKNLKSMSGLRAGVESLGKSLSKALGPLALLKGLVDAFLQSDKIVGDMAKGLNVSYSEALAMKQELTAAANQSENIFVTSKGMAESLMAINKTLGTNVMLNKEDLATFTELRTVAGFTNEELMGMQALSLATGKSLEDNTKEFMAQAKISAMQNGVLLNEKELAKGIKDVSAATTLSFAKNPKLIGEAVATAKALGMELSKVEGIADSLLNFEQSIESELQAELLLGKNINLEKARQAALNNDLKTVAEEIAKQAGDSAEFAKMNRIQQQALAEAVGMSREELAKTLFVQDQLRGATGKQAEEQEALLNARIEAVGLAEAQKELEEKGFEGLKDQASMQDKFNASVEKLKEIFVTVAEAVMPLMNVLSDVLKVVGLIVKGINYLGTSFGGVIGIAGGLIPILMKASVIARVFARRGFMGAIAAIYRSFAAIPFGLGIPLAAGAVIGLSTLIKSATSKVGDLSYTAKGGKLKTSPREGGLMGPMITTPDGKVFEGTKNDDILMAPGASNMTTPQPVNVIKTPTPPPPVVMAAPAPAPTVDNEKTERAIGETNTLLKQILNKQGTVKMNTTDVGTSFSMNTFNVQ